MAFISKQLGANYEQQAKALLEHHGYRIIATNFFCKGGEIDLIASKGNLLVFFEVKFRKSQNFGDPSEFITPSKQQKLMRCAQFFLKKHPELAHWQMRFDVLAFWGNAGEMNWIENAFGGW